MRFANNATPEETRRRILEAIHKLTASRNIPTMRAICRVAGIPSTSTVSWHTEWLAREGTLVRFTSGKGFVYFPAGSIRLLYRDDAA